MHTYEPLWRACLRGLARRAPGGPPKAEPGADAGPAAPQAPPWLTEMLGLSATDPARYSWQLVEPGDQDHMPVGQRLLHVVADRMHWLQALDQARRRAQGLPDDLSATGRAA